MWYGRVSCSGTVPPTSFCCVVYVAVCAGRLVALWVSCYCLRPFCPEKTNWTKLNGCFSCWEPPQSGCGQVGNRPYAVVAMLCLIRGALTVLGFSKLPLANTLAEQRDKYRHSRLHKVFPRLSDQVRVMLAGNARAPCGGDSVYMQGIDLLQKLLAYDPAKRISVGRQSRGCCCSAHAANSAVRTGCGGTGPSLLHGVPGYQGAQAHAKVQRKRSQRHGWGWPSPVEQAPVRRVKACSGHAQRAR